MRIRRLLLQDFRNLHSRDLCPAEGLNVLTGDNGQGKTNLLEAIHVLSTLSPIRPSPLKSLILNDAACARITGLLESQGLHKELCVRIRERGKEASINGKWVERGVDYFGELPVILFSPDAARMVRGAPEYRRRFLDSALARMDRLYLLDLKEYRRTLERGEIFLVKEGGKM